MWTRVFEPTAHVGPPPGCGTHCGATAPRRAPDAVFDECTFEVYGLDPGWEGGRWIRGWGRSRNVLTSVTLQHGPADLEAPSVSVETSIKQHAWHELAPTLAEQLYHDGAEASGSLRATFATKQPTSSWDSLILTVGGHPMEWRSLSGPHSWVAIARIDAAVVAIHANRLDPPSCRLASVDIGDYRSDPTGMFPEDPE